MIRRRGPGPLPLLLAALLGGAHASAPADLPANHADRGIVTVTPEAEAQGERALAAWIAYGSMRARIFEERQGRFHNQSGDDYAIELGARAALADTWAERRGTETNAYLDLLLAGRPGRLLEEYVLSPFAPAGLAGPGGALG